MRNDLVVDGSRIVTRRSPTRPQPGLVLLAAVVSALISAAVCVVAILAPAPPAAIPLVVVICVGGPVFAGWDVQVALASVRAERAAGQALAKLRRTLDQLPETQHPLGL